MASLTISPKSYCQSHSVGLQKVWFKHITAKSHDLRFNFAIAAVCNIVNKWPCYMRCKGPQLYWWLDRNPGPVSISEKTSYHKISWSLEAARLVFRIVRSLWNLTGTSAALLPMCLSIFKAIRQSIPISGLRDFTRPYDKTSFRILRRGPVH